MYSAAHLLLLSQYVILACCHTLKVKELFEPCKRIAHILLASEYNPALASMRRIVYEYFRTSKLKLDMYVRHGRWVAPILESF